MHSSSSALQWHLITCEYPPDIGGIAEHSAGFAAQLARLGDGVHVWSGGSESSHDYGETIVVHRSLKNFSRRSIRETDAALSIVPGPRHLLVQWVPHGYGMNSMNLFFCLWVLRRHWKGDPIELFVHEPSMPFGKGVRQITLAMAHRLMLAVLLRSASRVWMVIPGWEPRIRPYLLGRRIPLRWLPIATNIELVKDENAVRKLRGKFPAGIRLIAGHLGLATSSEDGMLGTALSCLASDPSVGFLLIGKSSERLRAALIRKSPSLAGRLQATGTLDDHDLSLALQACDLMLQPYPDGVSGRRTSTLNVLRHGVSLVTTRGALTEPLWLHSGIPLVAAGDRAAFASAAERLVKNDDERAAVSERASSLFLRVFDPSRVVEDFRRTVIVDAPPEIGNVR